MGYGIDTRTLLVFGVLTVFVMGLQHFAGMPVFKAVFLSFQGGSLIPRKGAILHRKHARSVLFLFIAYVAVIMAVVGGGTAVASFISSSLSGTDLDAQAIQSYLFAATIVGILVSGFARVSACGEATRDKYGGSLVCGLYWQVVITMSALLVFAVSIVWSATPASLEPVSNALQSLVAGYYVDTVVFVFALTMFIGEFIVYWEHGPQPLPEAG